MSNLRAGLLSHYERVRVAPHSALAEARGWGLELRNPVGDHWDTFGEFVDAYCRETAPAGVLVVASDPSVGGGVATGIPLTDPLRASAYLNVRAPPGVEDATAARFWAIVGAVKRAMNGPLEGLFSTVHLANAFPYSLYHSGAPAALEKYLPSMPIYRQAGRDHLLDLVRLLRPQVVATVGRLAYEAVASVADNSLSLATTLVEPGWERLVMSREYAEGLWTYPRAEFPGFRSYVVPVAELAGAAPAPMAAHAHDTLHRLFADAWT